MGRYAFPRIGSRPVSEVNTADVLEILTPIWHAKAETARAVRQRIRSVLEWAIAMDLRNDNPCDRVLPVLGPQNDIVTHRLALPHKDVAPAIATVRASGAAQPAVKLAFEFLVLTAARSGEVRLATWDEIASVAEGDQRADSAQRGRGRVQRAPGARGGHCRDPAHQCAQGGSGQEAFCRGGHGGGSRRSAGSPFQLHAQGRRRVRGALGGAELRRASGGSLGQWSLRLLADRVVELGHIDRVSHETVRRVLRKTPSNRGGASAG